LRDLKKSKHGFFLNPEARWRRTPPPTTLPPHQLGNMAVGSSDELDSLLMARKMAQYPVWLSPSAQRAWDAWPTAVQDKMRAACRTFATDPRFTQFWSRSEQGKLAADVLARLLKGAVKTPLSQDVKDSLTLARVADFLAMLACCEEEGDLPWAVKEGLKWLAIERRSKKRGRPKGRKSNYEYFLDFTARSLVVERAGVWALRESLKAEQPHRWRERLRDQLQQAKWPKQEIDAVILAKTLRSLAIQLTAYEFGVEYDTVQKAIRTYGRQSTQNNAQPGRK